MRDLKENIADTFAAIYRFISGAAVVSYLPTDLVLRPAMSTLWWMRR